MSALKYQLRELLPSLKEEANKVTDPEVKRRYYLIKAVSDSPKDVKKTCEVRGFSTDFFYKWGAKLLASRSLEALKPLSRSPKRLWNKTTHRIEKRVRKLKKLFPFRGPETISFYLKKDYNMKCPPSTVYGILKRAGLISQKYQKQRTKKHIKRYRRPWPGYLQLDIKYVSYKVQDRQFYQISAIDHHSSWRLIRTIEYRTLPAVIAFLDELEQKCPFSIIQIQTDNATEFTDKFSAQRGLRPTEFHLFDEWCKERKIQHKLIPVGEKEINGKVENSHKWDDQEFYSQRQFNSLQELQIATRIYSDYWNEERYTKTLGWRTPNQVVELAYVRAIAFVNYVNKLYKPQKSEELEKIHTLGGYFCRRKNKTKKLSAVARYLQWMDGESKKLKSYLPVPLIFKIFSANQGGGILHRRSKMEYGLRMGSVNAFEVFNGTAITLRCRCG